MKRLLFCALIIIFSGLNFAATSITGWSFNSGLTSDGGCNNLGGFSGGSVRESGYYNPAIYQRNAAGDQTMNALDEIPPCLPPTISCPANISINTDPGVCNAKYTFPSSLILQYNPTGSQASVTPVPVAFASTSISASSLSQVGFESSWTNTNVWPVGRNSASSSVPPGIYLTFDVTVPAGTDLASLKYDKRSYQGNGPTKASLRSSLDGFTADISTLTLSPAAGDQSLNFDLNSLAPVSGLISFRIYFYGAAIDLSDWSDLISTASGGNGLRLFAFNIATAVDCLGNIPSISYTNLSSDGVYVKGTTTITATATDFNGSSASCTFTVTVNDNQKPTITCPGNISDFAVAGVCGKVITYSTPTASDNCPGVSVMQTGGLGSGQIFPVGVTTETWKATDMSGNSATCSFTVTIIDNQKPIITGCPSNQTKNTDPGICTTTATWVAPTASDNCPGVLFTSNFAPGSTFSKGVTTVNYLATDASSNTQTCSFTVTVVDNQMPTISGCPGNISANTDLNQCFATVSWVAPTASDNCMISTFTTNKNPGATFSVGVTTVTYTATDMSGNTKTCSFTVTVTDVQLPTINCPANAMRNTGAGVCTYTVSDGEFNATASDACGISSLLCTLSGATTGSGLSTLSGLPLNKGITTALWKATDANGNMNNCQLTIEVKDMELPKITCPANLTVTTLPGQCVVSGLILGSPTGVSDNCMMTTVTNNGLSSYPVGVTIVTWKVTDMSGNTATCTQKITVNAYSCGTPTQVLHYDTTFNAAKVKWLAGKCATGYELRIRKELSPGVWGAWSAWVSPSGPGLLHQYTGLDPNSFYNYQIHTICGSSFSAAINDWFHTLPIPFGGVVDNRISQDKDNTYLELPTNLVFVPNPANELTTVIIEGFENHQKTVTMFDLYGKLVFSIKVEPKQNQLELDLKTLGVHTGVYMIRVADTEKQKTGQLMIERE